MTNLEAEPSQKLNRNLKFILLHLTSKKTSIDIIIIIIKVNPFTNVELENDTKFPRGYILLDVAICFIFHTNRTGLETNLVVPKNWDYGFGSVINLLVFFAIFDHFPSLYL